MQWWKLGSKAVRRFGRSVGGEAAEAFFQKNADKLAPQRVYRAKTWARFDKQLRLPFVDVDLLPLVEREAGTALTRLIEEGYATLQDRLGWGNPDSSQGQWMLKSVFWMVSAKMLRDKGVETFSDLDFSDVRDVFNRVAQHHSSPATKANRSQLPALSEVASHIAGSASLRFATTEALAFVYENAMITKAIRDELGTHSTPTYLVDYIVGRLAPWIEQIDVNKRNVFEPACGHAGFLAAAMRVLTELLPEEKSTASARRTYLRSRIHGCEMDPFAREIARLSLTLADIPNPDGWDLAPGDMFETNILKRQSQNASILLANPPFANFSAEERARYQKAGFECRYLNKTAEMLRRTLPNLRDGSCFGVVVPQGFLHHSNAAELRREVLKDYELDEILLFPDKVFAFSDMESAVLIGKRRVRRQRLHQVRYRRVRERSIDEFRASYAVSTERSVSESRFHTDECDLRVPELEEVWNALRLLPHRLCDIADVGRGFSPKRKEVPPEKWFYFDNQAKGRVSVFHKFPGGIQLHGLPRVEWADLSEKNLDRSRWGITRGVPQVLFNYARTSRGPWRLKGLIDEEGHSFSKNFVAVRPKSDDLPLGFFWAIVNSPMANAYAYSHLGKRDNLEGTMRQFRVPDASSSQVKQMAELVRQYFKAAEAHEQPLFQEQSAGAPQELLMRIDAAVLDLYDLPVRLERDVLDYFNDWKRLGVPFRFDRYLPRHLKGAVRLRDLLNITYDWPKTNRRRGRLIRREVKGDIGPREAEELERLQRLACLRTDLLDPFDFKELEQLHAEIVTGANG
ncbi:MAG: N-6 DNA methylase [Candidatus Nealsonbacteria bacterium]|nr:N-6 DNA methylase [Candidatus Nealsonbacteria bacterium]